MRASPTRSAAWLFLSALTAVGCGDSSSAPANTDDAGAGHDGGHDEAPVGAETGAVCDPSLTYANFGKAFFASYCTSCHAAALKDAARNGAPNDHSFDTLVGIQEAISHIDETAAAGPKSTNTVMPSVGPKPTLSERQKLGAWLACGAH